MLIMQHGQIGLRRTEGGELGVEATVATFEQIHLRVVQIRVDVTVEQTISFANLSHSLFIKSLKQKLNTNFLDIFYREF